MAKGKNQHVVPHLDGWAVIGAGNTKATKVTRTQKEADCGCGRDSSQSAIRHQDSWHRRENPSRK
mgnify:CR=1 FL=1